VTKATTSQTMPPMRSVLVETVLFLTIGTGALYLYEDYNGNRHRMSAEDRQALHQQVQDNSLKIAELIEATRQGGVERKHAINLLEEVARAQEQLKQLAEDKAP
jgi:hypothetical protein